MHLATKTRELYHRSGDCVLYARECSESINTYFSMHLFDRNLGGSKSLYRTARSWQQSTTAASTGPVIEIAAFIPCRARDRLEVQEDTTDVCVKA